MNKRDTERRCGSGVGLKSSKLIIGIASSLLQLSLMSCLGLGALTSLESCVASGNTPAFIGVLNDVIDAGTNQGTSYQQLKQGWDELLDFHGDRRDYFDVAEAFCLLRCKKNQDQWVERVAKQLPLIFLTGKLFSPGAVQSSEGARDSSCFKSPQRLIRSAPNTHTELHPTIAAMFSSKLFRAEI